MNMRIVAGLVVVVLLSACSANHGQAISTEPEAPALAAAQLSPLGLAVTTPGDDRLAKPIVIFGDMPFEPPDGPPVISKATALATVISAPDKFFLDPANVHAKLATWVHCVTGPWNGPQYKSSPLTWTCADNAKQQGSGGQVRRVLVWLCVETSRPGSGPNVANVDHGGAPAVSTASTVTRLEDVFVMVDANTGQILNGLYTAGF